MDKIINFLRIPNQPTKTSIALFLLRLSVGVAMMLHGWSKIQNPFSWMPPDSPVPGILQFLAALSEFGGGLALVLGLLTSLACLGIAITMLVATSMHAFVMKDPFVSTGGSAFELPLTYCLIALVILTVGPGKFSADAKLFPKK